jgi:DNA polymerase nu
VEDNEIKGRAQRQAINFMVQGSVAELVNYGLWRLVRAGYRVVAQIHDELLVEVRDTVEDRLELENLLREVYEVTIRGVPFRLDLAFGYSWGEGKG